SGEPRNLIMWLIAPLMLPMHIIGEFAKVVSLALRLFGNVFGEDTLIGVFALIGILLLSIIGVHTPMVGFPLQLPFMFLAMLTGFVQALVFALLSMIYFILVLPEEEH
ncbi:F0F1 ATP synthase subunit A, partial [Candidatus Sumerlaeota bacterium]|nr:F0F1 ATP synthase subunit A [Candidatus Sumerlaeota bacterium]